MVGCAPFSREFEPYQHPKIKHSWNNSVSDYTIYMAVIVQAQPWKPSAMIEYFDIIHSAYSTFLSSAWLKYDETHIWAIVDPILPWDGKQTELWTDLDTLDRPANGWWLDSGHFLCVGQLGVIPA